MDETSSLPISVEVPNNQLSLVKSYLRASNDGTPTTGVDGELLFIDIEAKLYEAKPRLTILNALEDVDQVNASVSLHYTSVKRAWPTEKYTYIEISRTEVTSHLCTHILR